MDDLDATLELSRSMPGSLAGKDGRFAEGFDNSGGQVSERTDLAGTQEAMQQMCRSHAPTMTQERVQACLSALRSGY